MRIERLMASCKAAIVMAGLAVTLAGTSATAAECPEVEATPWRAAVKHSSIIASVAKNYDGDWSAYIARWERQVDTARDIYFRGKALIVRFGNKRKALKGKALITHIKGLSNRIDAAYCLRDRTMAQADQVTPNFGAEAADDGREIGKELVAIVGCSDCHGEAGIATDSMTPHLAGQKEKYLLNQLLAFATNKPVATYPYGVALRTHVDMLDKAKLAGLKNAAQIAAHYSAMECPLPAENGNKPAAAPTKVEVCAACHGQKGISPRSDIPNLAGQHRDYLVKQLQAFRLTKGDPKSFRFRNRRYHQFMSAIAAPLSNEDMRAMADYFAALPCR